MPAMLDWLRSTITGDLAAAKAADEASPGPWVNTGQAGQEAADHIVLQQPRNTIARCEAELAILDDHEEIREAARKIRDASSGYAMSPRDRVEMAGYSQAEAVLHRAARRLASGYRHREGFNPDWVSG